MGAPSASRNRPRDLSTKTDPRAVVSGAVTEQENRTPPPDESVLEGILERIVYAAEEGGFTVARLEVAGRGEPVTIVGSLLGVQPGESLHLRGRWVHDRRYGEQFRVASYLPVQPSTLAGIERYLGSGLVRGVGKVMAKRLVEAFGFETLDVIESDSDRLTEVDGIGPKRSGMIRAAWKEQREIKDVMLFLQSHGVTTGHAIKIYKAYGNQAIDLVRENPYRLALEIFGIGFKTADRIAMRIGIAADSPRRAEAGAIYALQTAAEEGHLFLPRERLLAATVSELSVAPEIVETAIDSLAADGRALLESDAGGAGQAVYLPSLHTAETGVADRIACILRAPPAPVSVDIPRALEWFEERQEIGLAPEQREAVRAAIEGKVVIITGGPGTGKTTLVNAIIRILERKSQRILLAAPTGRAAKRLNETTGREAKTIHRLLEFSPRGMSFERNADRPLEADLVIVDEFSMVDILLAYHLLRAIPDRARLIVVGDADQLPSVGPGNVLRDMIDSGAVPVARLRTIFRQTAESGIVVNAHRVNEGTFPRVDDAGAEGEFFFIERDDPEEALRTILHLVSERIPRRFGLDPMDDIQVLTPMHRGTLGASNLNASLQALLNPSGDEIVRGSRALRVGDKVLQVRNNYDLEVFNGDIGRVVGIDPDEGVVRVRFEDRVVSYDAAALDELALAYACSIHKSQGSEYRCVVIPIHTQHFLLLQRNLLYTAITRGKEKVVLVGSKRALAIAVRNAAIRARFTRLAGRLRRAVPQATS